MKKISILLVLSLMLGFFSCHNEDWEFPDYDYSTVYFPYQYPFRTLILGDYETDNTGDNNLQFKVYAHIGGMYENGANRTVDYEIVPSLALNVKSTLKDSILLLPSSYYSIAPANTFSIPKGEFIGGITVQLDESFLDDTLAYRRCYVLPVRIIDSDLDSVLQGRSSLSNPDPRIAGNWDVVPKNFVLYGIKYINQYHGKYLHRGTTVQKDATNTPVDTFTYHQKYVEKDEVWAMYTRGRNKVTVTGVVRGNPSPGTVAMDLNFDSNNNCTVTKNPASRFGVTGSGKFVEDGDNWGNKPRNVIHLSYIVSDTVNNRTFAASDTFVVRDRAVAFEDFIPVVSQ